jgi:hypothetical protein
MSGPDPPAQLPLLPGTIDLQPLIAVVAPWGCKDRAVPLLPFPFPLRERVSLDAVSQHRPRRGEP